MVADEGGVEVLTSGCLGLRGSEFQCRVSQLRWMDKELWQSKKTLDRGVHIVQGVLFETWTVSLTWRASVRWMPGGDWTNHVPVTVILSTQSNATYISNSKTVALLSNLKQAHKCLYCHMNHPGCWSKYTARSSTTVDGCLWVCKAKLRWWVCLILLWFLFLNS